MNASKQILEQLILISIDSYENKTVVGRFWYGNEAKETPFCNLMQLLLLIDKILEDMGYPEESVKCKSFVNPDNRLNGCEDTTEDVIEPSYGALATFKLKILFRQNASWQGIVNWAESKQEQSFRSALELIMLIDSALTYADGLNSVKIG